MNKRNVLGIGVSTMDCLCELEHFPIPDEKMRAKHFSFEGGGNVANTLVAMSRLGCATKILSRVGNDLLGTRCIEILKEEGIDVSLLQVDAIPTPLSIVLIDLSHETRTIIHCTEPAPIHYSYNPSHLENIDLLYADGRNMDAYANLIAEASKRGIKIAVEAERKGLSSATYFPMASIVFASRQFHREFFGNESYQSNLDAILAQGPEIAVTTLGSDGVIVKTRNACIKEKAVPITPVDTTGAGDAFNAAFLYGILNQQSLSTATRFATQYAAESCKHVGARAGLLKL